MAFNFLRLKMITYNKIKKEPYHDLKPIFQNHIELIVWLSLNQYSKGFLQKKKKNSLTYHLLDINILDHEYPIAKLINNFPIKPVSLDENTFHQNQKMGFQKRREDLCP